VIIHTANRYFGLPKHTETSSKLNVCKQVCLCVYARRQLKLFSWIHNRKESKTTFYRVKRVGYGATSKVARGQFLVASQLQTAHTTPHGHSKAKPGAEKKP
jgi:hypothetical protein